MSMGEVCPERRDMEEVQVFYKKHAKELTDFLFDKDFLNKDLTRESIDILEDYIGYLIQSLCDSAVRCSALTRKIKGEE